MGRGTTEVCHDSRKVKGKEGQGRHKEKVPGSLASCYEGVSEMIGSTRDRWQ